MSRGGFKINKNSYDFASSERVSWLDDFANNIEKASKTAVQVARERRDEFSLQDQINSILSGKPVHATVEDLVDDYHKRTGLDKYLQAQSSGNTSDKVAFSLNDHDIFSNYPLIRNRIIDFAKNKVDTSYGQVSVPSIQSEILMQFSNEGLTNQDVENDDVARFISELITASQKQTPPKDMGSNDLGKGVGVIDVDDNDGSNTDFYQGLMPTTE